MGIAAIEEMAHSQGVEWVMVELTGLADPGESLVFVLLSLAYFAKGVP
jgi:G3E family GTPase